MERSDTEREILRLISDYKVYRGLCVSAINPNHAFRNDLEKSIKMCDRKLVLLDTALKLCREGGDLCDIMELIDMCATS